MTADISKYQEHREKLAKAMVFICDQAGIDSEDYKKLQMESYIIMGYGLGISITAES